MKCELCGYQEARQKVKIEGSMMEVCSGCVSYGKVLNEKQVFKKKTSGFKETDQIVCPDYGAIIRKKREELGIKQEHLAKLLAEKESIIQQVENSQMRPSFALARKMEIKMGIKLLQQIDTPNTELASKQVSKGMTIADLIKKR